MHDTLADITFTSQFKIYDGLVTWNSFPAETCSETECSKFHITFPSQFKIYDGLVTWNSFPTETCSETECSKFQKTLDDANS